MHNYNLWVDEPKLPASVIDVGLRTEPNLELLTQMKPSLVLLSATGLRPVADDKLERIAPTMGFDLNSGDGKPFTTARTVAAGAGARLGLESAGEKPPGAFALGGWRSGGRA